MTETEKLNKHDRYVQQLVRQIQDDYDSISTHYKLSRKKRLVGEVDVLAMRGEEVHLYEVKCSPRIVKARKQLTKLKKLFRDQQTSCFFYCGASNAVFELC